MRSVEDLLSIAKAAAKDAVTFLGDSERQYISFSYADSLYREAKSNMDYSVERIILDHLSPTQIPLLSEESGWHGSIEGGDAHWIIDPIDGTSNYIRDLMGCGISIALWNKGLPVFGVIAEFPSGKIAWGGKSMGAYYDNDPIFTSSYSEMKKAILCTGIPAAFDFNESYGSTFFNQLHSFSKVRMFGSASLSLIQVARGAADFYYELGIKIWDVAAGLAIIEGAGGSYSIESMPGNQKALKVIASNQDLFNEFKRFNKFMKN